MRQETKQIKLNIYPLDYENIQSKAKNLNMTMAEYIRHLTKTTIVKDKKNKISQVEKDTLRELNYIGVNLNQIAKKLNTENKIDYYVLELLTNISLYIELKI